MQTLQAPQSERQKFYPPQSWLEETIRILVIGAGGTGGEVVEGLAQLHAGLLGIGHRGGVHVTVMDGDQVSSANVGRQRFGPHDVRRNKAILLVHRHNVKHYLQWNALPRHWSPAAARMFSSIDLLITCVDSAAVRVQIAKAGRSYQKVLWMDYGNGATKAQCVLGHLGETCGSPLRLPHVFDLFPDLLSVDDTQEPSCSLAEALTHQDLFVNRVVANAGMAILWNLCGHGVIEAHGSLVNVRDGYTTPIPVDPVVWKSLGYTPFWAQ